MQYYTLGETGLRVSRLCLGTMTFGEEWGWGSDESAARQVFDGYLEAGGNFIDTADMYTEGHSERALGQFIAESQTRNRVVLATKFSFNSTEPGNPNGGGNGRKNILRALESSLERLGTDYIDVYILHGWDRFTPVEEVVRTLDDQVRAGKIRHYGLSNVPAWYASRAQAVAQYGGYEAPCAMQMEYSLLQRSIEAEYVTLGVRYGMGIMSWSPLGSGLLSGKYRVGKDGLEGEGRLKTLEGTGHPAMSRLNERNWNIIAVLQEVAQEMDRPAAQIALNWVGNRPGVATVIIGATKLQQVQENMAALDFTIPPELSAKLDEASANEPVYPYTFFANRAQWMASGGAGIDYKPLSYWPDWGLPPRPSEPD